MIRTSKRLRAAVAAAAVAAATLAVQAGFTGTAQAYCNGQNNPVTGRLTVNGVTYATAVPRSGTCNGNNFEQIDYHANVAGWRATVRWQNNGFWSSAATAYNTNWNYASFTDNNNTTELLLCADNVATVAAGVNPTWYCGWDGNIAVSSTGPDASFSVISTGF